VTWNKGRIRSKLFPVHNIVEKQICFVNIFMKMGGYAGRWDAKQGDGWLRREMGG
jgi:hypothetical protein